MAHSTYFAFRTFYAKIRIMHLRFFLILFCFSSFCFANKFDLVLLHGAKHGNLQDVKNALGNGANVNVTTQTHYQRPYGSTRTAADDEALFEAAAFNSALHLAVRIGHAEIIRVLLAHGASRTERNADNHTALDLAIRSGRQDIVDILQNESIAAISGAPTPISLDSLEPPPEVVAAPEDPLQTVNESAPVEPAALAVPLQTVNEPIQVTPIRDIGCKCCMQ
jgi:hypothetical protein